MPSFKTILRNIFIGKKIEPKTFEKDYLLLHETLSTLRGVGLTITKTGSEAKGHVPIYQFQVKTARLHFGTLVGLLNEPEKFKPEIGQINYYQNIVTTQEQIREIKYTFFEVAAALETLDAAKEVKIELVNGQFFDAADKIITLTEEGNDSLNNKKYLKQYERERNETIALQSTISTNFWMRWFTGILAFSAITTVVIQLSTCKKECKSKYQSEKNPQPSQTQKKDSNATDLHSLKEVYNKDSGKIYIMPKTKGR
jgi:hypothetical protein